MDVLELPRPVINFLRTMAKESCRYALSWDIFGGPDSVTLTLTWKLIDEENQSSILNEISSPSPVVKQSNYDDSFIRPRSTIKTSTASPSPRRSRRDENLTSNDHASIPAIFRSSRGKSLEGSNLQSNKINPCQHHQYPKDHQHVSSLERTNLSNHYQHRSKKTAQTKQLSTQSDQNYGNLYDTRSAAVVKCATISSLSSSSPSPQPAINNNNNNTVTTPTTTNNPPLSAAHTMHHQRVKQSQSQQTSMTPPSVRKLVRPVRNTSRTPSSHMSSTYATLKRTNVNNFPVHNDDHFDDDDDDTLDPWVKRFECSLEENNDDDDDDDTTEHSDDKEQLPINPTTLSSLINVDDSANTSGKVKFKTKPDYF